MFVWIISPAEYSENFGGNLYPCGSWTKPQKSQKLEPAKVSCPAVVGTEKEIFVDLDLWINTIKSIYMAYTNYY